MNIESFIKIFLFDLKNQDKNCINEINENKNMIKLYLSENGNPKVINSFIERFNNIVLIQNDTNDFKLIKKVLTHKSFTYIYSLFKNSNILIQACKINNLNAINWLLTMKINLEVQDTDGMTALMYASQQPEQLFVINYYLDNTDKKCLNLTNNDGNNALFFSINNENAFKELLKSKIDVNHINKRNESIFLYCCKNKAYNILSYLFDKKSVDVNIVDIEGKTAAMYLAENGRNLEIRELSQKKFCNFNYKNKNNESVLSVVLKNMYKPENVKDSFRVCCYGNIINTLIYIGCDFNTQIDEDGNTPLMVLMYVQDTITLEYIIKYGKNLDLSIKNKYGENASSLFFKCINKDTIYNILIKNPTFDLEYHDPNNNNTMLMIGSIIQPSLIDVVLENNINLVNNVNMKNENALIIAVKCNNIYSLEKLLKYKINVNQQDYLGCTALHYAIEIRNYDVIQLLIFNNADISIRDNFGKTPIDYANELNDKIALKLLNNKNGENKNIDQNENINALMKYRKEIDEYLYPCIHDNYSEFKMSDNLAKTLKDTYENNVQ
ncbi:ankyrin [Neocallimastix californiae]|jgi:ankyrin repeat protein|uniref:Ankyrin n=1 Tax=Neocallimastix californiae TaxID=1754190 RepID=A0A1Y2DF99_9FUNG|nr:ankyrin [Neocallimastix californiae]|eukprot:ORY57938.1 ankyrin [Neocallimastix californiae]